MRSFILLIALMSVGVVSASNPGFVITKGITEDGYNIIYKKDHLSNVKLRIFDDQGNLVMMKTYRATTGFKQPVKLTGVRPGVFVVKVYDGKKEYTAYIDHKKEDLSSAFHVTRLRNQPGKFLASFVTPGMSTINFLIYDQHHNLIHEMQRTIDREFATVVNIKNVQGSLVFLMSDGHRTQMKRIDSN